MTTKQTVDIIFTPTPQAVPSLAQRKAAIATVTAISEAIRELQTVPAGELYAHVMGHVGLDSFNGIIAMLKRAGLVEEKGHLLIWTGPLGGVK